MASPIMISIAFGLMLALFFFIFSRYFLKKKLNWIYMAEIGSAVFIFSAFFFFISYSTDLKMDAFDNPIQAQVISESSPLKIDVEISLFKGEEKNVTISFFNNLDRPLSNVFFKINGCYDIDNNLIEDYDKKFNMLGTEDLIFPEENVVKTLILNSKNIEKGYYRCIFSVCISNDCSSGKSLASKQFYINILE